MSRSKELLQDQTGATESPSAAVTTILHAVNFTLATEGRPPISESEAYQRVAKLVFPKDQFDQMVTNLRPDFRKVIENIVLVADSLPAGPAACSLERNTISEHMGEYMLIRPNNRQIRPGFQLEIRDGGFSGVSSVHAFYGLNDERGRDINIIGGSRFLGTTGDGSFFYAPLLIIGERPPQRRLTSITVPDPRLFQDAFDPETGRLKMGQPIPKTEAEPSWQPVWQRNLTPQEQAKKEVVAAPEKTPPLLTPVQWCLSLLEKGEKPVLAPVVFGELKATAGRALAADGKIYLNNSPYARGTVTQTDNSLAITFQGIDEVALAGELAQVWEHNPLSSYSLFRYFLHPSVSTGGAFALSVGYCDGQSLKIDIACGKQIYPAKPQHQIAIANLLAHLSNSPQKIQKVEVNWRETRHGSEPKPAPRKARWGDSNSESAQITSNVSNRDRLAELEAEAQARKQSRRA